MGELFNNLSLLEKSSLHETNFEDLYYESHGNSIVDTAVYDFYKAMNDLDRCKAVFKDMELDVMMMRLFLPELIKDSTDNIKLYFQDDSDWLMDRSYLPVWKGESFVIPIIENN